MTDREEQQCIIEQLCYEYDVDVELSNKYGKVAGVFLLPRTIYINPELDDFIETFFHELGHYHCYRNRIFPSYHGLGSQTRQAVMSTAYRAENWVDHWAEAECKKFFPNFKWVGCYRTERDRKQLMNYYRVYWNVWYPPTP